MASKGDVKFTITGDDSDLQRTIKRANSGMDGLAKSAKMLTGVLAAVGGAMAIKQLGEIADKYTLLEGRLKLVTGSTQELARVQDELFKASQRTRSSYEATATLYTGIARSTKELGMSQAQLVGITEDINKAMIVSGASQEEAANSMRQMQQALQGGVVRAEEYNSIMEQTPRVLQAVADGLGVTMGELRKQMLDGNLTAEKFLEGFQKGAEGIRSEFGQLPATIGQALTALSNSWQQIIADSDKASGSTRGVADAILDISKIIDENRDQIVGLFTSILDVTGDVIQSIGNIGRSMEGWAAVSDGKLSIFEFATMDDQDLSKWLKEQEEAAKEAKAPLDQLKTSFDNYVSGLIKAETQTGKVADKTKTLADYTKQATDALNRAGSASDTWIAFDRGMSEANKSAEEYLQTLSDIDALVTDDAFFEIAGTIEAEMEMATETSTALWEQFATDTGGIIEDFISGTLKGEFDSIGDLFQGLLDSMLDMLISFIAKAAANDLINAIFGAGSSGGSALSLVNMLSSSSSSSGSGGSGGGLGSLVSSGSTLYKGYSYLTGGGKTAVTYGTTATQTAGSTVGGGGAIGGGGAAAFEYSSATAGSYTGAGGYVGGSVAEGGALGSGGSAAAGGGSSAGMAAGAYAFAAIVAAKAIKGLIEGPSRKTDSYLNSELKTTGMSGGTLLGAFAGPLTEISDPLKEMLPSLSQYTSAMADLNSGLLTLTKTSINTGETINVTALQYDAASGTFSSVGGVMQQLEDTIARVGAQTGTLSSAYIEQLAAQYGLSGATQALIQEFLGVQAAAEYAAQGASRTAQAVNAAANAFGMVSTGADHMSSNLLGIAANLMSARATAVAGSPGGIAQASYAVGTDYVPRDMVAQIHKGEAIIPAAQNSGSRGVPDRALSVNIGGKNMASLILSVVDGHIEAREQRGVSGRVYR